MAQPPRRVEKRLSATRASYYREGRVHLKRAVARFPGACPLQALVDDVELPLPGADWTLRPATSRRYREDYLILVTVLVRVARKAGEPLEIDPIMKRIEAALRSRRGRPVKPRGSSLRIRNPTDAEAGAAFAHLKTIAQRDRSMSAAAAALYLLVEPRIGLRPIEYCGATIDGTILVIPNAKLSDGQDSSRRIDLSAYTDTVLAAIRALISLMPAPGNPNNFTLWRNAIASSLARASLTAGQRRLSLYSFRHIAVATWEKNGFSAAEIAHLAGHLSTRTARTHYARAGSGWHLEALPKPVTAPILPADQPPERSSDEAREPDPSTMSDDDFGFDFTPIPVPSARPAVVKGTSDQTEAWKAYASRLETLGRQIVNDARPEPRRTPISDHPRSKGGPP